MKISLSLVRNKFQDVLEGRISREDADRWAHSIIQLEEAGSIEYSPPTEKARIWEAVMYLYGIDIQERPNEYLHSVEDIKNAMLDKCGR